MLQISRIDHVGQVVADLDQQRSLLEGLFGFQARREWDDTAQQARGVRFSVPGATGIDWEVLAPLSERSSLQPFLDSPRGPGVHHIAVQVPDLGTSSEELGKLGAETAQEGEGWLDATIDPQRPGQGLLFRFFDGRARALCGAEGAADVTPSPDGRAIGITAFDHICHAYRDRDELARWYEQALGMREIYRTPDGEHDDLADLVMDVPGTSLRWEVIQPVGEESFIQRFLETRGPAPHHVTFQVADWDHAQAACEEAGVPMFDENRGETDGAAWRDAFIHPKHTGGMLVQLFWEERPGVWVRSDKIPSGSGG